MRRLLGMKVTTVRWSENGARGGWSVASGRGGLRFARLGSEPAPQFGREQLTPKLVEIGQGKHSLSSRQVLGQTAISHFGEPPQLLDYPKGVFAARAGPRTRPVDHPPALAQRPATGSPIDPVAHSPTLEKRSIVFLPVRLIAEDFPLLSVQQVRQLSDVGDCGVGRSHRMYDTALIRSDVQLHSEVPILALAGLLHLRVTSRTRVLGRTRRRDDGCVHDGTRAQQQPPFFEQASDRIEDH